MDDGKQANNEQTWQINQPLTQKRLANSNAPQCKKSEIF